MNTTALGILLGMLLLTILIPVACATDTGIKVDQQLVTVTLTDKGLLISEDIRVTNAAQTNVTTFGFWIQQDATSLAIVAGPSSKNLLPFTVTSGNIRTCNLTTANLSLPSTKSLSAQITYYLPTSAQTFVQTLLYNTTLLTVTYNDQTLFQGEHLLAGTESTNTLQIRLYKPTEAPLSMTVIIILFIIVVAILGVLLFMLQRRRSKTQKSARGESEETLLTKKTLLLSLLKDLEKQYRAKDISDETYNKLKDEYKQQAVDTMKRLEDMKR